MFSKILTKKSVDEEKIGRLYSAFEAADALIIGAGAGLSTSAGFTYAGPRFQRYFYDFSKKYGFNDMYSGGFYPYDSLEDYWAYWSRYVYVNRYMDPPESVYSDLHSLARGKDYFVLTTNVDHCFQKAGFDKNRLFYTQGDYGLFQCSKPCHSRTYENEGVIRAMLEAQGFYFDAEGIPYAPAGGSLKMSVPSSLVPRCPRCGRPMTMNLRADGTFVEDEGWHEAAARYSSFLERHEGGRILFLELGVGYNTPVIIKYPFWKMTAANSYAVYACINKGEAAVPVDIKERAICINADIGAVLELLKPALS